MKLFSNKKQDLFFLFLIFCLALFLRLYRATEIPPSLNWDEAAIGYNSFSILKTGKDEWGKILPPSFKSFGDYKAPLLIYLTIPFVAVFGLSEIATRLPIILIGSLTPVLSYFLLKNFFYPKKNNLIFAIGAICIAVLPWHIHFTRAAFEASLSLFLLIAALTFYFKPNDKKGNTLIIASIFFVLSVYAYHSAKVFFPLLLLAIIFYDRKKLFVYKKKAIYSLLIFFIFLGPLFLNEFFLADGGRAQGTLIFFDQYVKQKDQFLFEMQKQSFLKAKTDNNYFQLFFNFKPAYILRQFIKNYFSHFSFNFLFAKKVFHNYRLHIGGLSLITPLEFFLFLIGLILAFLKRNIKTNIMLAFFIFSLFAPSLSMESPHSLRGIFYLYSIYFYAVFALFYIFDFLKEQKYKLKYFFLILLLIFSIYRLYQVARIYLCSYPVKSAYDWQYGTKEAIDFVFKNKDNYETVYFEDVYGQSYIFYLFYSQKLLSPFEVGKHKKEIDNINFIKTLDKYPSSDKKTLYVSFGDKKNKKTIKEIFYPDKRTVFTIYEN